MIVTNMESFVCLVFSREIATLELALSVCLSQKQNRSVFSLFRSCQPIRDGGEVNTALFNFNFEGIQVLLTILKIAQEGYIETLCSFINSDITSQVTRVVPKWSNDPPLPLRC